MTARGDVGRPLATRRQLGSEIVWIRNVRRGIRKGRRVIIVTYSTPSGDRFESYYPTTARTRAALAKVRA